MRVIGEQTTLCAFELLSCYFDVIRQSVFAFTMHLAQAYCLHDYKKLPVTCIRPAVPKPRSWRPPNIACFPCLLTQTHLIQIISSLVKTPRPELGVRQRRDTKCAVLGGPPGSWLGTTLLDSARNGLFRSRIGHPWLRQTFLFPIYLQLGKSVLLPEGHLPAEFSSHPH